jgi:DegV family protein with EDD domain
MKHAHIYLPPEQMTELNIHIAPLVVTLDGKSYREDADIQPDEFYPLLAATDSLPTTSQPSAGDFAEIYRRLTAADPDILSIHMTSGLSGTVNAAKASAELVPEANVTVVDTKTLSAAAGWQVVAAARAVKAGWSKKWVTPYEGRQAVHTSPVGGHAGNPCACAKVRVWAQNRAKSRTKC